MGWRTIRYGPFTTSSCCSFTCGTLLQLRPSVTRDQMAKPAPRTVTAKPDASRASECRQRGSLIQLSGSTCIFRSATPIRTGRYGVRLFKPCALCEVAFEMRHPHAHTSTSAPHAQPNAMRKKRSTSLSRADALHTATPQPVVSPVRRATLPARVPSSPARLYDWSPSHDQRGMLRPFGTSSAESWLLDIFVLFAHAK